MSNISNDTDSRKARKRSDAAAKENSGRSGRNINSILIIVLSVVVVISIAAGIVVNLGKKSTDVTTPSASGDSSTAESSLNIEEATNDLTKIDSDSDIATLIANYRKAFTDGDTTLLQQVYNSSEEINSDILTATSQVILSYNNTVCYTKRGLNSGEYVVFVYDELELANIKTHAPNLSVFYVKTAESGSYYIYRGDYNAATGSYAYDADTQAYLNKIYLDQDVSTLIENVNTKQDSACANDSDLMEFMEKVRAKTSVVTPTETESGAETESGTESESGTETESSSETEADAA